jgi:phosphate starvation-inducible PhoH-like protein
LKPNTFTTCTVTLDPVDNRRLASLCGRFDEHLRQIEKRLGVEINNRGNIFQVIGNEGSVRAAISVLEQLYLETKRNLSLSPVEIHLFLQQYGSPYMVQPSHPKDHKKSTTSSSASQPSHLSSGDKPDKLAFQTRVGEIKARSPNQKSYIENILEYDVNFGIGPAGTGKTYLAVAAAVSALEQEKIRRIILVRPAVEAGERLGFLPGDLSQKIDPYLRPLYDALHEMLGFDRVNKLIEQQVIEIASLAYMRGRTLNDSFIILDEAQTTTVEQMKMFLTRLGFSSTAVITGDITQVDLPRGKLSGLRQAMHILENIPAISFTFFDSSDVVRHPVVQQIIEAYQQFDDKEAAKYDDENDLTHPHAKGRD